MSANLHRRDFLQAGGAGLSALVFAPSANPQAANSQGQNQQPPVDRTRPTRFQVGCMTLPYGAFSFDRALRGLQTAGYRYVCWGTSHADPAGKRIPILNSDAPLDRARELAKITRGHGLEPVMMFGPSPEALDPMKNRIRQAQAAGIGQILTMGSTRGNDAKLWVRNFKELAPIARDHGVVIVVKQHGGNTGTGEACAAITREVNDEGVKVCYDAGNVMDYNNVDPIPDIRRSADEVRSFAIKDHRNFPRDEDCGPGFGEIDHYKLLAPVAFTGRTMPLCCENIFVPVIPRPKTAEEIDALARRAREFLELVIQGLQL
jgi:sugar phosphate isomerase/epimerase